jgi:hypothetical protein
MKFLGEDSHVRFAVERTFSGVQVLFVPNADIGRMDGLSRDSDVLRMVGWVLSDLLKFYFLSKSCSEVNSIAHDFRF